MDEQDLPLVAGTTFDFELTWETENDQGELEPVDITGCSVVLQVRGMTSKVLLMSCTSTDGDITVEDPVTGRMEIHISPEKTANQDVNVWQDARWEVRVIFPSGDAYSLVRGWAKLTVGSVQ
ncbi:TPA: hypothetical protein NKZ29_004450 [Vibrio parahaemolyticus]|nr:hypothetical protein [Vibrio parahaemolyticus]